MTEQTTMMPTARVAVFADNRLVEVALPTGLPLREVIPPVRRLIGDEQQAPPDPVSLAPIGGAPFSLDATLDTVGVVDGDLLVLLPVPAGPTAPGIVEDIADAAVIFSKSRQRPWCMADISRAARLTLVGLVMVATGFTVAHHIAVGGVVAPFIAAGLAAVAVLAGLLAAPRSPGVSAELSLAALAPIAAAFALAIPGDTAERVLLAAAGVTAWSVMSLLLATSAIAWFTVGAEVGIGTMVAAGVTTVWDVSLGAIGCGLIIFALVVTVRAPQLSAMCARFPLPTIPAPGDPTPLPPPLRMLSDLPRRVRACDAYQTGFIAGAVLLAVLGSLALIIDLPGPWGWYVVVAAAFGSVLRARVWDSVPCKAWLLAYPFLLGIGLLAMFCLNDRYLAALWVLAGLAGQTMVWVVVAMNPRIASADTYSLPVRRLVGFVAAGVDASLIPVIAYLLGLFAWVLNR